MKRYKVYWSIFNLFSESQSEVVKLQQLFKGLTGTITAGTWYADNAQHALIVAAAGYVIDMILGCFYFEQKT